MKQARSVSLARYNSFGVDCRAEWVIQLDSVDDLPALGESDEIPLVLGGGTNVLLAGDPDGPVLLNRIRGMRVVETRGETVEVEVAAGEIWHSLVLWTLARGLSGLENLSLIPGLCGAAPIQNIGAYGVELSDLLVHVKAWDWREARMVTLDAADCDFAYRHSRFKGRDRDRFLITSIRLRLSRHFEPRLEYAGLSERLAQMEISTPTARDVSRAVIRLHKDKLPDPARIGNAGSFFKNPELDPDRAGRLQHAHPGLPVFPGAPGRSKLSAAWMIQHCGWKGRREGDAGVSDLHALVLVNHGGASGQEILALARRVAASVEQRFGVALEPEPHIVGAEFRPA